MEIYLSQLAVRNRSQPELITFPLPPTAAMRSRHNVHYLKAKLARSASIPKKLARLDIAFPSQQPQEQAQEPAYCTSPASSASSGSLQKDPLALPRLPLEDPSTALPYHPAPRTEPPRTHTAPAKCARYPITYKLRANLAARQPALLNRSLSVSRVKSVYDEHHHHQSREAPSQLPYMSCTDLPSSTAPPSRPQQQAPVLQASPFPLAGTRPEILVPPPRTDSLYCWPTRPPTSSCVSSVMDKPTGEYAEKQESLTVQSHPHTDVSSFPGLVRKHSVLDRPRPLERGRGQSFSNHHAEFDHLISIHQQSGGNNTLINPGRARPPRALPSICTSSSPLHSQRTHNNRQPLLRGARSFADDRLHKPLFSLSNRRVSRGSFFSSLARLDPDGHTLDLALHLPPSPSPISSTVDGGVHKSSVWPSTPVKASCSGFLPRSPIGRIFRLASLRSVRRPSTSALHGHRQ